MNGDKWLISDPQPFESLPLTWERAFGGEQFAPNPLGMGYLPRGRRTGARQMAAAQYRIPRPADGRPLGPAPARRIRHAGYHGGPNARALQGTYDDEWLENHAPGLPRESGFSAISTQLLLTSAWTGPLRLTRHSSIWGMHPDEPFIQSSLPGLRSRCFVSRRKNKRLIFEEIPTSIDTVWLFPHAKRGITIHRGQTGVGIFDATDLKHMLIAVEYMDGESRDKEQYLKSLNLRLDEATRIYWNPREDDICPPEEAPGDEYQAPDPMEDPRVRDLIDQARAETEKQVDAARAYCQAAGLDPDQFLDKAAVMAKFDAETVSDLHLPPPFKGPDDIPRMMKYMQEQSARFEAEQKPMEELMAQGKKALDDQMANLKQKLKDTLGDKMPDLERKLAQALDKKPPRPVIPEPPPSPSGQLKKALAELEQMKAPPGLELPAGTKQKLIEAIAEAEKSEKLLAKFGLDQADKAQEALGAAFLPPPEPRTPSEVADMRLMVLKAAHNGESCREWDLTGAVLCGLDLKNLDLSGAVLDSADLSDCDLSGAKLDQTCLVRADLRGAKLCGADMTEASLGKADCTGADFSGADLSKGFLAEADLRGAKLAGANLNEANCMKAVFDRADLTGCNLQKAVVLEASLSGAVLHKADLFDALFMKSSFPQADFSQASLKKATFVEAQGPGCDFRGADLDNVRMVMGADFSGSDFSGCTSKGGNWRSTKLQRAVFSQADLEQSDFYECDLERAVFQGANCKNASFMKAKLKNTDLSGTDLFQANLMSASMIQTDLRYANLYKLNALFARAEDLRLDEANLDDSMLKETK